ncbi:hypothetical protein MTP99_012992 [Tenebrio molitor]|jgi:hypothetical protein|uniref:uncharacterized protein n=1 Tax=Tenebrio molitor TaxID=7067 RepID=UPI00270FDB00|nr:hypothetical protein MTP99_012992 [Tenebrio molitor]
MYKNFLFFALGALFLGHACNSDLIDDAEEALNLLRKATIDNLNGGFLEHTKLSIEVDTAAIETKAAAQKQIEEIGKLFERVGSTKCRTASKLIEKVTSDAVDTCVDNQADETITFIYTKSSGLTDSCLKTIFDQEKEIVICGQADEDCLNGVIATIQEKADAVPGLINDEIETDRAAVEEQIGLITACADAAVGKAKELASTYKACIV